MGNVSDANNAEQMPLWTMEDLVKELPISEIQHGGRLRLGGTTESVAIGSLSLDGKDVIYPRMWVDGKTPAMLICLKWAPYGITSKAYKILLFYYIPKIMRFPCPGKFVQLFLNKCISFFKKVCSASSLI